ncbi:Ni,Fe-hydrogenase III small subunit [Microbacterium testaceum StLB037]|uniref:Ni,Fe-hydrogenase III small subunit n=1 Tax=Microbacterium testaceum (strain StLB037) TaxID=979556 RepID=E8NAX4_MICTS|nr:hypothetical protein [Microbacterium testaceum]BAJ73396.1 Ni,Fe-hydrogenase III small subunit [Microbacterium testaceum StLB037]
MTVSADSHSDIDRKADRSEAGGWAVRRRTVVAGAAWGLPVIMIATAAPAYAAASQTVNLAFDKVQYVATGCQPITGATVTATNRTDGRPVAGLSISVTLPRGFSYPTGATTYTGTTNASGVVALPDIVTPSTGGTVTLTAVAATVSTSASASVTVNLNTQATLALGTSVSKTYASAAGGVSVGNRHFLTASGDLFFENTKIASGVASAAGWFTTNWAKGVCFVLSSGGAKQAQFGSIVDSYPAVPVGSKAVGGVGFLAPNGDLYYGNTVLATGVVTAWGYRITATGEAIDFVGSDGVPKRILNGAVDKTYSAIPTSVPNPGTSVGNRHFLTASGDLFFENTKIASGVASAAGWFTTNWAKGVCFVLSSGGAKQAQFGSIVDSYPAVPVGSKAVGGVGFLAPNGDLYYGNTVLATGVVTAWGYRITATGEAIDFVGSDGVPKRILNGAVDKTYSAIPTSKAIKPVGQSYFIAANGDLYRDATKLASNVVAARAWVNAAWTYQADFVTSDGKLFTTDGTNVGSAGTAAAGAATLPVGAGYFLTAAGALYLWDTLVTSNVTSAYGLAGNPGAGEGSEGSFVTSDAKSWLALGSAAPTQYASVPVESVVKAAKPVGQSYFIAANGDLYRDATKLASNVVAARAWVNAAWTYQADFVTSDGKLFTTDGTNVGSAGTAAAGAATLPVGAGYFLTAAGALYLWDTLVTSNVTSAYGLAGNPGAGEGSEGSYAVQVAC